MPGPLPKNPNMRQRRNRSSTASTLRRPRGKVKVPALPVRGEDEVAWHRLTLAWWADVWASPMAGEFDASDVHGLYVLAVLVDAFWERPSKDLAAEIRLQRQCFGLSPLDRRRLQWEIDRGEEAGERTRQRRKAAVRQAKTGADPRSVLHAV